MQPEWKDIVKQYRQGFSLTQLDMARLLAVSQKTVSRWESGENKPSLAQQRQFRDLLRRPSFNVCDALSAAVRTCPVPRSLFLHPNLNLQALSPAAIAKRPSMAGWIGCDLAPIACGVLADVLADRALQRSILKGEIACVHAVTRSVYRTPEHRSIGTYRTTVSYFRIDGRLFRDALSVPAPANTALGYWPVSMDAVVSG